LPDTIPLILSLTASGALAWCALILTGWLAERWPSTNRHLRDYGPPAASPPPLVTGSREHRIRVAFQSLGLDAAGRETPLFLAAAGLLGLAGFAACALAGLPLFFSLGAPVIAYLILNGWVNARWDRQRQQVEKEIPIYLMNLASVIQLTPNVIQALQDAALSLNPQGGLLPWVDQLARRMQAQGPRGLAEMQEEARALSPALVLLAAEVGRLWETGGQGYARSFQMVAGNLSAILEGRARGYSKAAGSWGTIRVIVMALGGAILLAFTNPSSGALFRSPFAQLTLLAALAWAAFGWTYISDLIRTAVE
jgi:hypothetical protein